MRFIYLFGFLFFVNHFFSQTLAVKITGLRNNSGNVQLGFFINDESFKDDKPLFLKVESKATTVNGVLTIIYNNLKPGTYGVALLDDENSNTKMDFGILLPKEGFGFSNYYHTSLTRPSFSKFSFVYSGINKVVEIKVKYM